VKRVAERALGKLRAEFARRGVTSSDVRGLFHVSEGAEEAYLALVVERLATYFGPQIAERAKREGRAGE
jgi:hypothetical protein